MHEQALNDAAKKMMGRKDNLVFLLVGRTGVGKSSTINSLLGEKVAPTGKYEPTTMETETFLHEHGGLTYEIIDTPGLCDDLPEEGNDQNYLAKIKKHAANADYIWFVSELDAARVTSDEKRGIRLITEALGHKCWDKSIIVFTRADKADDFENDLKARTRIVRQEIGKYYKESGGIPAVAVSNVKELLPNGKKWLPELFTQLFLSFSDAGALPLLESMKVDIGADVKNFKKNTSHTTSDSTQESDGGNKKEENKGHKQGPRIDIDEVQKEKIRDSAFKRILAGAAAGAKIGSDIGKSFGKTGEAVGAVAGALIGGIGGWLFN